MTKLSCLVRVGGVNGIGDKTRQDSFVLSRPSFQFPSFSVVVGLVVVDSKFPVEAEELKSVNNLPIGSLRQQCLSWSRTRDLLIGTPTLYP